MPSQSRTLQLSSVRWYFKCCFTFMQVIVEISVNSTFVVVSLVSASYPISKSVHRSEADFSNHYQRCRKQNWSGQARCL